MLQNRSRREDTENGHHHEQELKLGARNGHAQLVMAQLGNVPRTTSRHPIAPADERCAANTS